MTKLLTLNALDYFGARYYDHLSYRFHSVDPLINKEEALVNPQLLNLYSYCGNNPLSYFDPDGMAPIVINVGFQVEFGKTINRNIENVIDNAWLPRFAKSAIKWVLHQPDTKEEIATATVMSAMGVLSAAKGKTINQLARKFHLNKESPTTIQLLKNAEMTVMEFISSFRKGGIKAVMPEEFMNLSVKEALESGNPTVRKLLTDRRFEK